MCNCLRQWLSLWQSEEVTETVIMTFSVPDVDFVYLLYVDLDK